MLLANNVDINQESFSGETALDLACVNNNYNLAKILLESPKLILHKISKNNSCILHSISKLSMTVKGEEIINTILNLLYNNLDNLINLVDDQGYTPIHKLVRYFGENAQWLYFLFFLIGLILF